MAKKLCTVCGYSGKTKTITKGSLIIEIFLWLLILVPGLIYSLWRLTSRYEACGSCGSPAVIPLNSPAARERLTASTKYEIGRQEKSVGAYSIPEINRMLSVGQLSAHDYFFDVASKRWQPLGALSGVLVPTKNA
jgi:hypothetical protein